jgi:hypothetical protein
MTSIYLPLGSNPRENVIKDMWRFRLICVATDCIIEMQYLLLLRGAFPVLGDDIVISQIIHE